MSFTIVERLLTQPDVIWVHWCASKTVFSETTFSPVFKLTHHPAGVCLTALHAIRHTAGVSNVVRPVCAPCGTQSGAQLLVALEIQLLASEEIL